MTIIAGINDHEPFHVFDCVKDGNDHTPIPSTSTTESRSYGLDLERSELSFLGLDPETSTCKLWFGPRGIKALIQTAKTARTDPADGRLDWLNSGVFLFMYWDDIRGCDPRDALRRTIRDELQAYV